jgi:hypothetical protein
MPKRLVSAVLAAAAVVSLLGGSAATVSATNTPLLTAPTGTPAAVGSSIIGTAGETNLSGTSGGGIFECASSTLSGEVTKNSSGNFEAKITTATLVGDGGVMVGEPDKECTGLVTSAVTATPPWCLRSTTVMRTDEFQIRGGQCSEAAKPIIFHLVTTGFGTCTYERSASSPIAGSFRTHPEQAIFSVTSTAAGSGLTRSSSSSSLCPASGVLELVFALENGAAQPAYLDG